MQGTEDSQGTRDSQVARRHVQKAQNMEAGGRAARARGTAGVVTRSTHVLVLCRGQRYAGAGSVEACGSAAFAVESRSGARTRVPRAWAAANVLQRERRGTCAGGCRRVSAREAEGLRVLRSPGSGCRCWRPRGSCWPGSCERGRGLRRVRAEACFGAGTAKGGCGRAGVLATVWCLGRRCGGFAFGLGMW